VLADLRHRHAVGEQPDLLEHHPLAGSHRRLQAVGIVRLDADHLGLRIEVFHVGSDAGHQPAAAHRDEDRVDRTLVLAQYLHRHGALAGDHVGIVVGVDVDVALLLHQLQRVGQRLGKRIAVQDHLAAAGAHALHLQFRRGARHDDGRLDAQLPGRQRHTLRVVAGRSGDHAARQFLGRKLRQPVVGAAHLEREHRLQILALEQNLVAEAFAKLAGRLQRSFDGDVVDARGEDLLDVVFEHSGYLGGRYGQFTESTPRKTPRPPAIRRRNAGTARRTRPTGGAGL